MATVPFILGAVYMTQDNKGEGAIDKVRHYSNFFINSLLRLYETGTFLILSPPRGIPVVKTRSRYSRDNILHINPSSRDEKRLTVLNSSLKNALKKQPTSVAAQKILPKYTNTLKYLYMSSQQQTKKIVKIISSSVVF